MAFLFRWKLRLVIAENTQRLNQKLEKLSQRPNKPLRENNTAIKTLDLIELPVFVKELLSNAPKHPVTGKFIETHIFAVIDRLVYNMRENGVNGEKLCEIEAAAKWYVWKF